MVEGLVAASDDVEEKAPGEEDPATAKLTAKLEKLEADLESQLAKAGMMQKRAWRNKKAELLEGLEACTAKPLVLDGLRVRLEKVGVMVEGKAVDSPPVEAQQAKVEIAG